MDTHGYPSLRINTHFTLTKVIVYNPKINVLDIGYTSEDTSQSRKKSIRGKTVEKAHSMIFHEIRLASVFSIWITG